MQEAIERLFDELVLGKRLATCKELSQLCRALKLPEEDEAALLDDFDRLLVYRDLVRGNLREALELSIPRTIRRLGPLFDDFFDRFLAERAPRTHYLRDVTAELLTFCRPLWQADARVPPYLHDLALHESLRIEVSALPALPRAHAPAPLELTRGVELCRAARLVSYGYAVHELPDDANDQSSPERRDVALFVYRSPEHDVRYLETTPLARAILERLLAGRALGDAIRLAAAEADVLLTEDVLAGAAKLLADLAERGVVWGPKVKEPSVETPK